MDREITVSAYNEDRVIKGKIKQLSGILHCVVISALKLRLLLFF